MSFFRESRISEVKHRAEESEKIVDASIAQTHGISSEHAKIVRREVLQSRRVIKMAEEAMELVRHPERYR